MLEHLEVHRTAFDSDEVLMLTGAFDKAWQAILASGAKYDTGADAEAARAIIAKHIIEAARQGERDQRRLSDGAVLALARATRRQPAQLHQQGTEIRPR
jgi:hypothetical protein